MAILLSSAFKSQKINSQIPPPSVPLSQQKISPEDVVHEKVDQKAKLLGFFRF